MKTLMQVAGLATWYAVTVGVGAWVIGAPIGTAAPVIIGGLLAPVAALWAYGVWTILTAAGRGIGVGVYHLATRRERVRREIRDQVRAYLATH
jgi:hypothetical protein